MLDISQPKHPEFPMDPTGAENAFKFTFVSYPEVEKIEELRSLPLSILIAHLEDNISLPQRKLFLSAFVSSKRAHSLVCWGEFWKNR